VNVLNNNVNNLNSEQRMTVINNDRYLKTDESNHFDNVVDNFDTNAKIIKLENIETENNIILNTDNNNIINPYERSTSNKNRKTINLSMSFIKHPPTNDEEKPEGEEEQQENNIIVNPFKKTKLISLNSEKIIKKDYSIINPVKKHEIDLHNSESHHDDEEKKYVIKNGRKEKNYEDENKLEYNNNYGSNGRFNLLAKSFQNMESIYKNSAPKNNLKEEQKIVTDELTENNNEDNNELTKETIKDGEGSTLKEFEFEDYNIITQLGEGSFGKIYLVEDKNKNFFSLKKIIANDDIELDSFTQEYELVNKVRHKNILKILGICKRELDSTTHVLYILMEVGMTDWEKEIKSRQSQKNHYSEEELKNVFKQIVTALAFLQNKNISHRDVKPQNILIFKDNLFKICDFGEAKQISMLETNKQLSTLRGTELYMSPLLFNALRTNQNDIKHNSFKSDVYSLGLCLLFAATLQVQAVYEIRNLFDMKSVNLFLNKVLRGKYSPWFINLLAKMLEIHEENRYDFLNLLEIVKDCDS
jgi:hypothetical protein